MANQPLRLLFSRRGSWKSAYENLRVPVFCSDVMTDCLKIEGIVEITDVAGPRAVPCDFLLRVIVLALVFERCDIFSICMMMYNFNFFQSGRICK